MNIASKITDIIIHVYEWAEGLDPHKVANEVGWYGGIQAYVYAAHEWGWVNWTYSFIKFIAAPLFLWLCLFFFKILVKYLTAKYLPGLKKYFHHKDESDD